MEKNKHQHEQDRTNQVRNATRPIDELDLIKIDNKQLGLKRGYIGKIKDIIMKKYSGCKNY